MPLTVAPTTLLMPTYVSTQTITAGSNRRSHQPRGAVSADSIARSAAGRTVPPMKHHLNLAEASKPINPPIVPSVKEGICVRYIGIGADHRPTGRLSLGRRICILSSRRDTVNAFPGGTNAVAFQFSV